MASQPFPPNALRRAAQSFVLCILVLAAAAGGKAQVGVPFPQQLPGDENQEPTVFDRYPPKPSLAPVLTVSFSVLGFSEPGPYYLLRRHALVSLDFLDENRLLFTCQKPGLVARDAASNQQDREIRALVLALDDQKIEAQASWTVPDQSRYLWMLKDGHFLLRDSDGLEQGDATLKTEPSLRLPGRLLWIELNPAQTILIANSLEPGAAPQSAGEAGTSPGQAAVTTDPQSAGAPQTLVVRTMMRDSGKVIRTLRVPWAGQTRDWPANAEGYVEFAHTTGDQWTSILNLFFGRIRNVGRPRSTCLPLGTFVTETELLLSTCSMEGGGKLTAVSAANGAQLWQVKTATNETWPLVVAASGGGRLARETLLLMHPSDHYRHKKLMGAEDVMGQMVRVMDTANGKVEFEAPLEPMFDGGGNVAISPSGRRVAILNDKAIEVFNLP